jgi:copper chaperone
MTEKTFDVTGMTCGGCARRVRESASAVPGVTDAVVDLAAGELKVSSDGPIDDDAVRAALEAAGYEVVT